MSGPYARALMCAYMCTVATRRAAQCKQLFKSIQYLYVMQIYSCSCTDGMRGTQSVWNVSMQSGEISIDWVLSSTAVPVESIDQIHLSNRALQTLEARNSRSASRLGFAIQALQLYMYMYMHDGTGTGTFSCMCPGTIDDLCT